jgi:hypothetical protein
LVLGVSAKAKVYEAVVEGVAVDVIYFAHRPFAMREEPR